MKHHNVINQILGAVSATSGIPLDAIRGQGKTRSLVYARYIIVRLLNEACPWLSLSELAAAIGRTNHGSALHALGQARSLPHRDKVFNQLLQSCQQLAAA